MLVKHSITEMPLASEVPAPEDDQSLLVDTAISHCEKLRRVLELEAWIQEAQHYPILAGAAERWEAERVQLMTELQLTH
jgi:hypothetical protein